MPNLRYKKIAERVVDGLVFSLVPDGTKDKLKEWVIDILEEELHKSVVTRDEVDSKPKDWRKDKPTPIEKLPIIKWDDTTVEWKNKPVDKYDY